MSRAMTEETAKGRSLGGTEGLTGTTETHDGAPIARRRPRPWVRCAPARGGSTPVVDLEDPLATEGNVSHDDVGESCAAHARVSRDGRGSGELAGLRTLEERVD